MDNRIIELETKIKDITNELTELKAKLEEMEKVKNSHKALFIDVYRMMANIIKNGIALEEEGEGE